VVHRASLLTVHVRLAMLASTDAKPELVLLLVVPRLLETAHAVFVPALQLKGEHVKPLAHTALLYVCIGLPM
jgi:hypothetical protein